MVYAHGNSALRVGQGWCCVAVLAMVAMVGVSPVQAGEVAASIRVDAGQVLGPVNHRVLGSNIEAADPRGIFSLPFDAPAFTVNTGQGAWDADAHAPVPEVVARARALNVSVLRYPGGCLAHNFNWKQAVGPREERDHWRFGLDEYIALCRAIGAEPMITVSDYVLPADEMPAHAAALVEYLNAPATENHPWAMKRKAWGNPEPYGVRYFELGNESDHGNHDVKPARRYTGEAYAAYAVATAEAMRAVDPTIQIGIVTVPGTGEDVHHPWNEAVYAKAGPIADFLVVHFYAPRVPEHGADPEEVAAAAMAVGPQLEDRLGQYRQAVREAIGRDLPLAVTEYNIAAVQDEPLPFRFSFAAALMAADLVRVMLNPEHDVLAANYWHLLNGYWGMFHTGGERIVERPAYALFALWGQRFGDVLCHVEVDGPTASFAGYPGVLPARGEGQQPGARQALAAGPIHVAGLNQPAVEAELGDDDVLEIVFDGRAHDLYAVFLEADRPDPDGTTARAYHLSYEARFTPGPGGGNAVLGLGVGDARGWEATRSAIAIEGAEDARQWQQFHGVLHARADAPGVHVLARVERVGEPLHGRLELRNIELHAAPAQTYPAYPLLTAAASLGEDGRTLHLMVFNKSLSQDIEAAIEVEGFAPGAMRWWRVSGEPAAVERVTLGGGQAAPVPDGALVHRFPAQSMTAIELRR